MASVTTIKNKEPESYFEYEAVKKKLSLKKEEDRQQRAPRLQTWTALVEPLRGGGRRQRREMHTVATTEEDARNQFALMQLRVIWIKPLADLKVVTAIGKVKQSEVAMFCKELAIMNDTGMAVQEAIELLFDESDNPTLTRALAYILQDLQSGTMSLWEAVEKHPGIFDKVFVALVRAGEESGSLPKMLRVLAQRAERSGRMVNAIWQALLYPAGLSFIGFAVVTIIYLYVLPKFVTMYREFGAKLPLMTSITMSISDFLVQYFVVVLIVLGVGTYYARKFYHTERGKRWVQDVLMKVRLFREIMEKASLALVSRSMATLYAGGQTLDKAVEIGIDSAMLYTHREALAVVLEKMRGGTADVDVAVESHYALRTLFKAAIKVGHRTGHIDEMLLTVAEMYETDVENKMRQLSSVLEPAIIVIIGIIVGFTVISLWLPIINLVGLLGT